MQLYFGVMAILGYNIFFTPMWYWSVALCFCCFGLPMGVVNHLRGWSSVNNAMRCVLSIGHCPSCAYRISDIEIESDGCTVCPECGGAWKLE